jgi:cytochrome P450
MNKLFSPHLGQSIFTTNGDNWKKARKLFTPAFHFKVLDDYLSESVDITNEFVDELLARSPEKAKAPIDVQEDLEVLTLKILLQSVFSTKTKDKGKWGHAFCEATKRCENWVAQRIDKPLHLVMPNFAYFRTETGKTFKTDASEMHALCRQMIRERMDANAVEGEHYLQNKVDSGERLDFLDICLSHTDADGNPISEDEILAQTVTFVAAGFGTTTSAVAFVLHLLAKNKDAQQKCHEEAVELLSEGQVDLNLLAKLKYINMCFKEGTRIFPPVGGIVRDLPEAKEINGIMVDAGTTVVVSIYGVHHNPEVWPEPEKFDPERFDPDGPKRDPFSWIIFSAGARNCIGQKYADMQSKMIMAKLLRAFEFDVVGDKSEVQPVPSVILKSANGVWLRATPRDVA